MLKRDILTYDLREKLIFRNFHDGLVKNNQFYDRADSTEV